MCESQQDPRLFNCDDQETKVCWETGELWHLIDVKNAIVEQAFINQKLILQCSEWQFNGKRWNVKNATNIIKRILPGCIILPTSGVAVLKTVLGMCRNKIMQLP